MSPEVQRAMEGQFQRLREKFGRGLAQTILCSLIPMLIPLRSLIGTRLTGKRNGTLAVPGADTGLSFFGGCRHRRSDGHKGAGGGRDAAYGGDDLVIPVAERPGNTDNELS